MKREPMSFKGAEKAIKEKFTAFYTPYTLADLRVKAQISSNKGDCEIYQEVLNWVYPQTYVFDENAVDMVAPWNFDEFAPFDPVFWRVTCISPPAAIFSRYKNILTA